MTTVRIHSQRTAVENDSNQHNQSNQAEPLIGPTVLPNTGTRLVPEYFCPIPEQIVLKAEQIVYRFELLHSGLLASFRNRFFKDQAYCKVVQPS